MQRLCRQHSARRPHVPRRSWQARLPEPGRRSAPASQQPPQQRWGPSRPAVSDSRWCAAPRLLSGRDVREPRSSSKHPASWKFGYPIYHAETHARGAPGSPSITTRCRACGCARGGSHRQAGLPVSQRGRGGDLLRMDRFHRERARRESDAAADDTAQAEEHLDTAEPAAAADMEAAGLMTDAGRRAVEVAQQNGWWTISDPVEDLVEPHDLADTLDANAAARAHGTSSRRAHAKRCSGGWSAQGRRDPGAAGPHDRGEGCPT